jgi:hypothetical protein
MNRTRHFLDLTGHRFERLVVVGRMPNLKGVSQTIWHVRCDCGEEKFAVAYSSLISGRTKSCGCLHREVVSYRGPKHLQRSQRNPLYVTWMAIKQRCYNEKHHSYPRYGGKGVKVCERWLEDFEVFANDMGKRPDGFSLDRIDSDGDYTPGNCRWANALTQGQNKRKGGKVRYYEWNGEELCLTEICRRENVSLSKVSGFLKEQCSIQQAVRSSYSTHFMETAKTLRCEEPRKRNKTQMLTCGTDDFSVERERIKRDAWLRRCMAECEKKGLTYRGELPST